MNYNDSSRKRPAFAVGNQRLLRYLKLATVATVVGVLLAAYLIVGKHMATHPDQGDFPTFYLTSVRMRHAEKIYWSPSEGRLIGQGCDEVSKHLTPEQVTTHYGPKLAKMIPCQVPNLNPPFMIVLAGPLAYLDYSAAWIIWSVLSLACIALIGRLIVRAGILSGMNGMHSVILWMAYFAYFPTMGNFLLGQVAFFTLLPIIVAWFHLRRGCDLCAGALLGLAASMKPFVGLFLIGLVLQKNWRAVIGMVVTCLICVIVGGIVLGFDVYPDYLSVLGRVDWQAASWNASLAGFLSRLSGGAKTMAWLEEANFVQSAIWLATSCLLFLYLYGIRHGNRYPRDYRADFLCAITIPAMLLISPLGWIYYFPMLLVTGLFLGRESLNAKKSFRLGFLASLAMTAIPTHLVPAEEMRESLRWMGISAIYPCGLLGLFALTFSSLVGRRNPGTWLATGKYGALV